MQEETLITYKWNQGLYSLNDLVILVKYKQLTPEQFFKITRYDYAAAAQKYKNQIKKNQNSI